MSCDVALTSVSSSEIPIDGWKERQQFCNATYEALKEIGPKYGFVVDSQMISHEVGDVLAFADIGFAKESHSSWVEWFYSPKAVETLIREILPMAQRNCLETPSLTGKGGKDVGLTPMACAHRIVEFMNELAKASPGIEGFTEFVRGGRHPASYREIEVLSVIAEGKYSEARALCSGILSGDVEYSSWYRVLPNERGKITSQSKLGVYWKGGASGLPPEGAVTFVHVIRDWLEKQTALRLV